MMKEVTYTQKGDYLIPDIQMETTEVRPLGKYGRMRRAYLQENNPMLMNDLILTEKLYPHLWEIQRLGPLYGLRPGRGTYRQACLPYVRLPKAVPPVMDLFHGGYSNPGWIFKPPSIL